MAWILQTSVSNSIFIAGGYSSGSTLDLVEAVDLGGDQDCDDLTTLPYVNEEVISVTDSLGRSMVCGGQSSFNDDGAWVEGPSMIYPRSFGPDSVRLSDGRYFVSGKGGDPGCFCFLRKREICVTIQLSLTAHQQRDFLMGQSILLDLSCQTETTSTALWSLNQERF